MIETLITTYTKYILYYLIFINAITILIYLYDKLKSNFAFTMRIDDSTFHTLSLFGGILSTFILIILFNRRNVKITFQFITYIILGIWIFIGLKYYKYLAF